MNPHRTRKPRRDGAALVLLADWRHYVEGAEQAGGSAIADRPCCYQRGLHARDRLESLAHNGGRRAHRLRVAVARLDERYRAVTVERGAWRSEPWWARREPL